MHSLTLAQITMDGTYSTGLRSGLDDARLADGLKQAGLDARLYAGKAEGRVVEIVRQLVRARTDMFLFSVSKENLPGTYVLVHGLKELRPDAQIFFWFRETDQPGEKRLEVLGRVFHADTPETMLRAFVEAIAPELLLKVADAQMSPYRNGILSADRISTFGFTGQQPRSLFEQELAWLSAQHIPKETVVPIHVTRTDESFLIEVCETIGSANVSQEIELHADARGVTQAVIDSMQLNRIYRLCIEDDQDELSVKPDRSGINLVLGGASRQERDRKRVLYSRNGMIALHTGIYLDGKVAPALYHLELNIELKEEDRQRAYAWASPHLAMRSAVVLEGPLETLVEHLPLLEAPDNVETGGWPKHSYAIGFRKNSNDADVYFDGKAGDSHPVRYVPLSKLSSIGESPTAITFATVRTADDIAALEVQLDDFHRRGVLRSKYATRSMLFENSCRWMGIDTCHVMSMRRVQVVASSQLLACRDAGVIGQVGDAFDAITKKLSQLRQMDEVRRSCATCVVKDQCSKCVHLPDEWGGRYCELRIKYPHSALFFALAGFPQLVSQYVQLGMNEIEMEICFTGLPQRFYKGATGTIRNGNRPVIATLNGQNLAWWLGTRKIVRLSLPLAMMAEAWWMNAPEPHICEELCKSFNVSMETAAQSLAAGTAKLRSEEIIYE